MKDKYDVLVVVEAAAGVGAAVGAAKTGARVGLLEAAGCLGGAGRMRNVLTYCGSLHIGEQPVSRRRRCGRNHGQPPALGRRDAATRHRGVS